MRAEHGPGRSPGLSAPGCPAHWRALLAEVGDGLGSPNEARWVLERASGLDGADLLAALDDAAPARAVAWCRDMVRRRRLGEPLQYVLGRWGFRGLDLLVDGRVLIPRPETEQVVEVARAELGRLRGAQGDQAEASPGPTAVDLGTGSGAIALSLAAEVPGLTVWATDASAEALAVARANLAGLGGKGATRVRLARGDWYAALPAELRGRVGLVVSNPPYIAEVELGRLPAEVVGWEPRAALVAGPTGLEAIGEVVGGARDWLDRPGVVVVEIAPHQAGAAVALARQAGFDEVEVQPDLAGLHRALVARVRARPPGPGRDCGA